LVRSNIVILKIARHQFNSKRCLGYVWWRTLYQDDLGIGEGRKTPRGVVVYICIIEVGLRYRHRRESRLIVELNRWKRFSFDKHVFREAKQETKRKDTRQVVRHQKNTQTQKKWSKATRWCVFGFQTTVDLLGPWHVLQSLGGFLTLEK